MWNLVGFRMQQRIDNCHVRLLALVVDVEDKRILSGSPTASVAEAPEGYAIDRVLMLDKDRKLFRVCLGLRL